MSLRERADRSRRPDGCPGALQLHAAADGGLARIRLPGGVLTEQQLRALAFLADAVGSGALELTSRANLQLRGVGDHDHARLAEGVAAAGLLPSATHERVRNILASPLTGRDDGGLLDIGPYVARLDAALCARPSLARLPGRFLFALDDGRGDVAGLGADVGVVAVRPGSVALLLAGQDSGVRIRAAEIVEVMLAAADAFLAVRSDNDSHAWRLAELANGVGLVRDRVCAGRGVQATGPSVPSHLLESRTDGPVGFVRQSDGRMALAVVAPLGRLSVAQACLLADAAAEGGAEVRVTPWRGVVIVDLAPASAEHWARTLTSAGLVVDEASRWVGVSACTGMPGCDKALADVRADAERTVRATAAVTPGLPVHWVGCERRCGRPRGHLVEVVATEHGYDVSRDGRVVAQGGDLEATAAAVAVTRRVS